jgi:hypothetical protein
MAPTRVGEPFHRPGLVYEEKVDGWRILAYKDGATVGLVSRTGVEHSKRFRGVAETSPPVQYARGCDDPGPSSAIRTNKIAFILAQNRASVGADEPPRCPGVVALQVQPAFARSNGRGWVMRKVVTAWAIVGVVVSSAAPAMAGYRIVSNQAGMWKEVPGEFESLAQCETEAKAFAVKSNTQAGCLSVEQFQVWQSRAQAAQAAAQSRQTAEQDQRDFGKDAKRCASASGSQVNVKPDARVSVLGTAKQRFDFDKCMSKKGHDLE